MDKRSENGNITLTAGGPIAKGEFVKFSNGNVVKCTAATDVAIGVALDGAAAAGDIVPVAVLGSFTGTVQIKAAGTIAQGAEVTPQGKEQTSAGTTELICGRALDAAAAGDMIEIAHAVCHAK